MFKKISVLLCFVFLCVRPAFCGSEAAQYFTDFGIAAYKSGNYTEALTELKKALIIEPNNQTAQTYMNLIFQQELERTAVETGKQTDISEPVVSVPPSPQPEVSKSAVVLPDEPLPAAEPAVVDPEVRGNAMDDMMANLGPKEVPVVTPPEETPVSSYTPEEIEVSKPKFKVGPIIITGEVDARAGVASRDFVWNRANWDMNERNWRSLSYDGLNRGFNTYDSRIYDRLNLQLDTSYKQGFNFHSNIMVDPWSAAGKSEKVTIKGANGDVVQVQIKHWSNNGYSINQTVATSEKGDLVNVPEMKIENGRTQGNIKVTTSAGNTFIIPEIKVNTVFQPTRELWLDYTQENLKVRAFPIAYENQAVTFDDPLKLSNNRMWWEDSPWIRAWKPGTLNRGLSPVDYTKGYWDSSLSGFARDSEGRRLVGLRGANVQFYPAEGTSIEVGGATPMSPWQDYAEVDNYSGALRVKQTVMDNLRLGFSGTSRTGYNLDNRGKLDAWNYVLAGDASYEFLDGLLANFEVAHSKAKYDLSESSFLTESRGYSYYFSLTGRYPFDKIIDTKYGYDGIQIGKYEPFFNKFRFFAGRMDKSFDAPLSSYVETRDDEWWSRHLHFRTPFKDYYAGEGELLNWNDVKNFGIGNGMDIGRNVLNMRVDSLLWDKRVENLFDIRTVNSTDYKFVENVTHEEMTWHLGDKLTTKFLGIYHVLPKTTAGKDPYLFDSQTREPYDNAVIEAGKDPSVGTGSLGTEYKFFDWLALNGIWEYTNDISFGLDNYPRRLLNEKNLSSVYDQYGEQYREQLLYLYGQGYFPKPPYPYSNVFKAGLKLNPLENMEIYLDYTRNPFEKAGYIDDNMNHIGFQLSYNPMPKVSVFFRYTYSRWQDLDKLIAGMNKLFGHHNFFGELTYRVSGDEDFTLQYGEGARNPFMGGSLAYNWDPYGGSLATLDTQHVIRLYYRRKF